MREQWQGNCWHCGQLLTSNDFARESRCPACSKPTYCCRNCARYAKDKPNDCAEPIADWVSDKERSNFCGYFEPAKREQASKQDADELLRAAQSLFE